MLVLIVNNPHCQTSSLHNAASRTLCVKNHKDILYTPLLSPSAGERKWETERWRVQSVEVREQQQQSRLYTCRRANSPGRVPTHHFPLKRTKSSGAGQWRIGSFVLTALSTQAVAYALWLCFMLMQQRPDCASLTLPRINGSCVYTNQWRGSS